MRRKDREVSKPEDILDILKRCDFLHLGLCSENKPYIVPMNFGYEKTEGKLFIYLHGAKEGKKSEMIDKNPNVCFEAECSYKTLKAEKACGWSAEYESVMGEGIIEKLGYDAEKKHALDIIMQHYDFPGIPEYPPQMLLDTMILRIEVLSITGKRHLNKKAHS